MKLPINSYLNTKTHFRVIRETGPALGEGMTGLDLETDTVTETGRMTDTGTGERETIMLMS